MYEIFDGLISIIGGTYAVLMATGVLPKNSADPEKTEEWREKWGKPMLFIGPFLIFFGIYRLVSSGVF